MNPTKSPTQGQPDPRKISLKVAFGPLFSHCKYFFVGWDWLCVGKRLQETQPNQYFRIQTPYYNHPFNLILELKRSLYSGPEWGIFM